MKQRIVKIIVTILLIFVMLFSSFVPAHAFAPVTVAPEVIRLLGSMLVAAGVTFTSSSDLESAILPFYESFSESELIKLTQFAQDMAIYKAYTVGSSFLDKIKNFFTDNMQGNVDDGLILSVYNAHSYQIGDTISFDSSLFYQYTMDDFPGTGSAYNDSQRWANMVKINNDFDVSICEFYPESSYYNDTRYRITLATPISGGFNYNNGYNFNVLPDSITFKLKNKTSSTVYWDVFFDGVLFVTTNYPLEYSQLNFSQILSLPLDYTYSPQSNVDTSLKTDTVIYYPDTVDELFGVPAPDVRVSEEDQTGVTVFPYPLGDTGEIDIPVDDTGTITGDGTGTGVFEGTGTWALRIPILGDLLKILQKIFDALRTFFDVSNFSLDFNVLKVGITETFPFCIPFDFYKAVRLFALSASDFVFNIDLTTDYFTIDHTVDLSYFRIPFAFFRYVVVFWFSYILMSKTRDFMKW